MNHAAIAAYNAATMMRRHESLDAPGILAPTDKIVTLPELMHTFCGANARALFTDEADYRRTYARDIPVIDGLPEQARISIATNFLSLEGLLQSSSAAMPFIYTPQETSRTLAEFYSALAPTVQGNEYTREILARTHEALGLGPIVPVSAEQLATAKVRISREIPIDERKTVGSMTQDMQSGKPYAVAVDHVMLGLLSPLMEKARGQTPYGDSANILNTAFLDKAKEILTISKLYNLRGYSTGFLGVARLKDGAMDATSRSIRSEASRTYRAHEARLVYSFIYHALNPQDADAAQKREIIAGMLRGFVIGNPLPEAEVLQNIPQILEAIKEPEVAHAQTH
jgi:hypothetical protein